MDTAYLRGRSPEMVTQQLCDGGSDLIQLRAKDLRPEAIRRLAEALLPIAERAGVGLVINDYWHVAVAVGAPLCHLGQEDFFQAGYAHVSQLAPSLRQVKIGFSSHAPAQAERAVAAGAAYLGAGPVFATGTKPDARPVTLEYVRWAAIHVSIPWFAIGGITLENIDEVLAAGARGVCVVSAILKASNIVLACRAFRDRLSFCAAERQGQYRNQRPTTS
jgi:thiamine-phosphate pyrophosphorylase